MCGEFQASPLSARVLGDRWGELWRRLIRIGGRNPKGLRLCESLALGERRFIAVVEFERARFLVGGTASTMVLLSRLEDSPLRTGGGDDGDASCGATGDGARASECGRGGFTHAG
jgi:hypothetical protein